jgi:hypothetical protein
LELLNQIVQQSDQVAAGNVAPLFEMGAAYNDGSLSEQELAAAFLEALKKNPQVEEFYAGFTNGNFAAWFQEGYFENVPFGDGGPFVYSSVAGDRSPLWTRPTRPRLPLLKEVSARALIASTRTSTKTGR